MLTSIHGFFSSLSTFRSVDFYYPIELRRAQIKLPNLSQALIINSGNLLTHNPLHLIQNRQSDSETIAYSLCDVNLGIYKFKLIAGLNHDFDTENLLRKKRAEVDGSFKEFIESKREACQLSKDGMFLEHLLPLITMYEPCTKEQYKKIDDFLMPIWIFNNLTAKHILNASQIERFVRYILDYNTNEDFNLDDLVESYCMTKPGFIDLLSGDAIHSQETIQKIECFKKNVRSKYMENLKMMREVFLIACRGFTDNTHDDFSQRSFFDCLENNKEKLSHSAQLFIDFFDGCIKEKPDSSSEKKEDLKDRTNSGGCKLMVQAVANILGLPDSDNLVDKLNFIDIQENGLKNPSIQSLKNELKELLNLQGEANVIINDVISLYKEVLENEVALSPAIYDNQSQHQWLKDKIGLYHKTIEAYHDKITSFTQALSCSVRQDNDFKNVIRHLGLISAALAAVLLWSLCITFRYKLVEVNEGAATTTFADEKLKVVLEEFMITSFNQISNLSHITPSTDLRQVV